MLKFKMGWASATGPDPEIVLSSRIRLARNFSHARFPHHSTPKELKEVLDQSFEALRKSKPFLRGAFLNLEELDSTDRRFLMERHLISHHLMKESKFRGVSVGEEEILSVMINEEDHLRIQGINSGLSLKEVGAQVKALDEELGKKLPYAFETKLGFLTACPTNVGTGLRASCLVHLPALTLTGQINRVLEGLSRLSLVARGFYGEGTQVMGDFFQISNATSLGHAEQDFTDNLEQVVRTLIQREKENQKNLAEGTQKLKTENLVYRSLGILTHARSISFEEAMQHLSYVRMGLSLKWDIPASLEDLNELQVLSQPAHIQMQAQKELEPLERDEFRATLIRKRLQK
ncbi:MAG: protein arginine kinase [Elusimicrobia bacterium]|nr:protein arginine kinase [Elusimicrobiota bacterium]